MLVGRRYRLDLDPSTPRAWRLNGTSPRASTLRALLAYVGLRRIVGLPSRKLWLSALEEA